MFIQYLFIQNVNSYDWEMSQSHTVDQLMAIRHPGDVIRMAYSHMTSRRQLKKNNHLSLIK